MQIEVIAVQTGTNHEFPTNQRVIQYGIVRKLSIFVVFGPLRGDLGFALRLLSLILGENSSSRLFQELRERRGLCYHVSSDVSLFSETGALEITLALEPEHRQLALDCIRRELDDLMENGPTADEIQRAKRYTIGQSKIGFETTASHLFWTAESLLYHNRIIEPEEIRENIRRVTLEDAARVAAATFHPDRAVIAEIAPA